MAKIANPLKEIKNKLSEFPNLEVYLSQLESDDSSMKEFISLFSTVTDDRKTKMCTYQVEDIVGIVFLGILHGYTSWVDIADYTRERKDFFEKYMNLSNGIPVHDTLMRVFSSIHSDTLEQALVAFLKRSIENTMELLNITKGSDFDLLCIDGKELKGSGRKYNTPEKIANTQQMNFYFAGTGICIRTETIDSKTNEIPVAQKILKTLNLKKTIVTADAMNAQKRTVELISNNNGYYVMGLKGNHSDLHDEVKILFDKKTKYGKTAYFKMETEKNHNQVETREFYNIPADKCVFSSGWEKIRNVVLYKKTTYHLHTKKERIEKRYYITSLNDIELIANSIRQHWAVENQLHWHLDVNFDEDANPTLSKNAQCNLSIVRKTVLTLCKMMQPLFKNISIRRVKNHFRMSPEKYTLRLFAYLGAKDIDSLIK